MLCLIDSPPAPLVYELVGGDDQPAGHEGQAGEQDLSITRRGGIVVTRGVVHTL